MEKTRVERVLDVMIDRALDNPNLAELISNKFSDKIADRLSETLVEKISEKLSGDISSQIAEKISGLRDQKEDAKIRSIINTAGPDQSVVKVVRKNRK